MSRFKGTFTVAANYEPLKAAPFDARQLVEAQSDLVKPATWQQKNGDVWTYVGMIVVVSSDIEPSKNGLYILTSPDYTDINNWEKQATTKDIDELQEQIENLEVGSGSLDLELESEADLPEVGDSNTTYYIIENQSIQRWDEDTQTYISYGGTGDPTLDINLIFGGNANGTN